jgi:spore germination cell wall hydrolase CwlJ-like protein
MIVNILFAIVVQTLAVDPVKLINNVETTMNHNVKTETNIQLTQRELNCLALNIYHESHGEPLIGQLAVASVTLNRATDDRYPNDVCSVVWQDSQFSWTNDRNSDKPKDAKSWKMAQKIAITISAEYSPIIDVTDGATMFHAVGSKPSWRKRFEKTAQIGGHIFYR